MSTFYDSGTFVTLEDIALANADSIPLKKTFLVPSQCVRCMLNRVSVMVKNKDINGVGR